MPSPYRTRTPPVLIGVHACRSAAICGDSPAPAASRDAYRVMSGTVDTSAPAVHGTSGLLAVASRSGPDAAEGSPVVVTYPRENGAGSAVSVGNDVAGRPRRSRRPARYVGAGCPLARSMTEPSRTYSELE
jgi:hypothetical protein